MASKASPLNALCKYVNLVNSGRDESWITALNLSQNEYHSVTQPENLGSSSLGNLAETDNES